MTCPVCLIDEPMDPETGYRGDDICPDCKRLGWDLELVEGRLTPCRDGVPQGTIGAIRLDHMFTNPRRAA